MAGRLLIAALASAVMLAVSPAPAPADTADTAVVDNASATSAGSWTLGDRFSREVVRPGDTDVDPWNIEHVYELQYRLQWRGLFKATPTGYFGPVTKAAVREFLNRPGFRGGSVSWIRPR